MNVAALTMNDPERLTVASHSHSAPAPNAGTLTTESAAHHHHQHQHHHHQILENVNEVSIQPSASQSTSNEENHASLNSDGVSLIQRKSQSTDLASADRYSGKFVAFLFFSEGS